MLHANVLDMAVYDLVVFHHFQTRSVRVVWLCEELGLDYEVDEIKVTLHSPQTWPCQSVSCAGLRVGPGATEDRRIQAEESERPAACYQA